MNQDKIKDDLIELSHLRWHCRRGVKELDVVFSNYLENNYLDSNEDMKQAFKALLAMEDPLLLALVMDQEHITDELQNKVLDKMKNHTSNN